MKVNDFIKTNNLGVGTIIDHDGAEWVVIGIHIDEDDAENNAIRLARNSAEGDKYTPATTTNLYYYDNFKIVSYPVKYHTLPKFHRNDDVFFNCKDDPEDKQLHKGIVLTERDETNNSYLVFVDDVQDCVTADESELSFPHEWENAG